MMRFIWKYYIPILMIVIGLITLGNSPDEPILKSVPIVPGKYQTEIAVAFMVFGLILGAIVHHHGKIGSGNNGSKGDKDP